MKKKGHYLFCASSLLAISSPALAQEVSVVSTTPSAEQGHGLDTSANGRPKADAAVGLEEIVVTARRQFESLQDVPQTVNAVSSETLQKLTIQQFQDVQTVAPGLILNKALNTQSAALRGISFEQRTAAQPSVAFYLNEAPVSANYLFQALFDIGQIEVLKGPQGTARGVSAPSGAITLTTRKPDTGRVGGYISGTATDRNGRNVQGAINMPIITDVLALRVAGVYDRTNFNGVRSINNDRDPYTRTWAGRASLLFQPSYDFSAQLTYQHVDNVARGYQAVAGAGRGTTQAPALTPGDRLSVQDGLSGNDVKMNIVTGQIEVRIFGQKISYVGSYQKLKLLRTPELDIGNLLPNFSLHQDNRTQSNQVTQEIRIESEPGTHFVDYAIGAFYSRSHNVANVVAPNAILGGGFGNPAGPANLAAYNSSYVVPVNTFLDQYVTEKSIFGNLTLHITDNTELSGGIRHIWSTTSAQYLISTGNALNAAAVPGAPASCAFLPPAAVGFPRPQASIYPGACDFPIPGATQVNLTSRAEESPTVYNISLSHHLRPNFLVYATTGTAYRPPVPTIGIQGPLASSTNPQLAILSNHLSEKSTAYEIGFKLDLLQKRARLNASIFRQKFSNLTIFVPGVQYNNNGANTTFDFTASVDAIVKGFDIDAAFQITPQWNISAQASYADAQIQGSRVPCNLYVGNTTTPVYNIDGLISLCPGVSASRLPKWNAVFQTEYVQPLSGSVDGFVRGLLTYYPTNRDRVQANFTVPNYSLVNLYLGARSSDGAWEVSVFGRNVFKTQRTTDLLPNQENLNSNLARSPYRAFAVASNYYQAQTTAPREFGLTLRYAFGGR